MRAIFYSVVALLVLVMIVAGARDGWLEARMPHAIRAYAIANIDVSCSPPAPCDLVYRINHKDAFIYRLDPGSGELVLQKSLATQRLIEKYNYVQEERDFWTKRSTVALSGGLVSGIVMRLLTAEVDSDAGTASLKDLMEKRSTFDWVVAGAAVMSGYALGRFAGSHFGKPSPDSPEVMGILIKQETWDALRDVFFQQRVMDLVLWQTEVKERFHNSNRMAPLAYYSPFEPIDIALSDLLEKALGKNYFSKDDFALLDRTESEIVLIAHRERPGAGGGYQHSGIGVLWLVTAMVLVPVLLCASVGGVEFLYRVFMRRKHEVQGD